MKCNSKLLYYKKLNKNGTKKIAYIFKPNISQEELDFVIQQLSAPHKRNNCSVDFSQIDNCDGKISCEISAQDEPSWGGSYAKLDVLFKCDKCKGTIYPDLPNEYNINDWINNILDKLE